MKDDYIANLTALLIHNFALKVGRMYFWTLEWKQRSERVKLNGTFISQATAWFTSFYQKPAKFLSWKNSGSWDQGMTTSIRPCWRKKNSSRQVILGNDWMPKNLMAQMINKKNSQLSLKLSVYNLCVWWGKFSLDFWVSSLEWSCLCA